jgi:signal transduction histidine kinase
MSNRFFVRSTITLLVVGFLTLLGIIGMTIWLGARVQVYFNETIEARDTRSATAELRSALQAAESSQRGFLFTGNEIYLAPYGTAKTQAARHLNAVNRNLSSYPENKIVLQRLTTIIDEKFNEMDHTINLKRDRHDEEALAITRTNRGKALLDEANVFFSSIIRSADQRLTIGVNEQKTNAAWLRLVSIIGGFVIVIVVGTVILTLLRYTRDLARARDEVEVLNASLEKRVEERTADLAQANNEIQRFAHIVTHDLRAPLISIGGFASEIEESVEGLQDFMAKCAKENSAAPDAQKANIAATVDLPEAVGYIRKSINKMDRLINELLKLSREGRRSLNPEHIILENVIKANIEAIQHQLAEANGNIELELAVPELFTDRLSLEQILGNLFDNAVKYRSKNRSLQINVRTRLAPDDKVAIEITDNGRGIADHDHEHIFELFRRSGAQDQSGDGIGLAYVRTLSRKLGGDITVASKLDTGTTFHIVLPVNLQDFKGSDL